MNNWPGLSVLKYLENISVLMSASSSIICSLNAFASVFVFSSCFSSEEYRSSLSLNFFVIELFSIFLYLNYLFLCCIYLCKSNTLFFSSFFPSFCEATFCKQIISSLNLFSFLYIESSDNSLISSISLYLTKLCLLS